MNVREYMKKKYSFIFVISDDQIKVEKFPTEEGAYSQYLKLKDTNDLVIYMSQHGLFSNKIDDVVIIADIVEKIILVYDLLQGSNQNE